MPLFSQMFIFHQRSLEPPIGLFKRVTYLSVRSNSSAGSITRAASLPHLLHVPRSTSERPDISPSRSCSATIVRHFEHQTFSRMSFLICPGICSHRFFAGGVSFGKGIVLISLIKCRSKSSFALRKPSSVIPTDLVLPTGFNM
jgi:hypothetical protein